MKGSSQNLLPGQLPAPDLRCACQEVLRPCLACPLPVLAFEHVGNCCGPDQPVPPLGPRHARG